ncbi:M23 family metallopeptidase [Tepidibacillus sp. HK-1]|uniref:M23 family metallopeptidase n=1 Tax=Tepidibacillus sp. HK-1 TaxID=1883407 RepID=UPI000853A4BC|nr:M23 family metallopeptidase [Tepidibacillus sp. HK-1]GBF11096.1 peptidase family M23 [Tepidibacillus sp. HK-1]
MKRHLFLVALALIIVLSGQYFWLQQNKVKYEKKSTDEVQIPNSTAGLSFSYPFDGKLTLSLLSQIFEWEKREFEQHFSEMSSDELISYLDFLSSPLKGAKVSTRDSHLPGALRSYRNGFHEGIDWYTGVTGITINQTTPVLSMADGSVVRVDHDFVELTKKERTELLNIAKSSNQTPEYILDRLRGRTVWVQYPKGVLVRYAHLSAISKNVVLGKGIKTGEVLGYVGNSGTSDGVFGNDRGLHLHTDILIYNHLFWENLDKRQIRQVLKAIFF